MIRNFADKETERFYHGTAVARFASFARVAYRRLIYLNEIQTLHALRGPGLQLEKLTGDRAGQLSIRINQTYRICFLWKDGDAYDVSIVDYH